MYVNMTTVNVQPDKTEEAFEYTMGDEAVRLMRQAPGFQYALLLEDQSVAGRVSSVTVWDTQEQAEAWYTSPDYAELIKGLGPLLTSAPERHHYKGYTQVFKEPTGA